MFSRYIAKRNFYKELFIIILPIILQFFIQNFINFLDNIMVGQLGEEEIAAVTIANQYYKLFYPTVVSICTGAAIFTAQYFGSNNNEKLQKIFGIKLIFPLIITLLFLLYGFIFMDKFIQGINNDEMVVKYAKSYMKIALWSYIPLSISTAFTFTFRPLKLTKIPMIASSIGMITNTILNYFLIYGISIFPSLGVEGAAIGTVVARCLELFVFILIFTKKDFPFKTNLINYFKIDLVLLKNIILRVIPLLGNELAYSIALFKIFLVYSNIGTSAINVISIADIVSQVVFILASGLGTATSILVGYKLGKNELDEAEKNADYLLGYAVFMGFIIMIIISSIAFIVPQFYRIYEETKLLTTYAILIQGFVAPVMMLTRIPFFVLRSGGRVIEVLILDSGFMWVVKVPVAIIFGYIIGVDIITLFLAVESTRFLNAIVSMIFYNQKKWLKNLTS